jgi:hypothetical protein
VKKIIILLTVVMFILVGHSLINDVKITESFTILLNKTIKFIEQLFHETI